MSIEDRLVRAADALREGVEKASIDPARIPVRARRRRLALVSVLIVLLGAAPLLATRIADRGEDTHVAARGPEMNTTIPASPPSLPPGEGGDEECRPPATAEDNAEPATTRVVLYFFCGPFHSDIEPIAVPRQIPKTRAVFRATMEELLKGTNERERNVGFRSPFDNYKSPLLHSVSLEKGQAVIDFTRAFVDENIGGGTAAGIYFFGSLNSTIFQFPEVQEVIYRIEGDAEAFCLEFQMVCEPIRR